MSSLPASSVAFPVFQEYIGATNQQAVLTSVPNLNTVPFHFLLAFATDYDKGTNQNGVFKPSWAANFTPEIISDYKATYDKSKILLSIGWYDDTLPFKETDKSKWISNAISSITDIINDYNLDGLDVNYWEIETKDSAIFAECVGKVIKELKDAAIVDIVSISPRASLKDHYTKLYSDYSNYIDLVNYQFYTETGSLDTVAKFKAAIASVQTSYPKANIIMGYSTDKRDGGIKMPKDVFFKTYHQMADQLSGIFVWCADKSLLGYQFEKDAQSALSK